MQIFIDDVFKDLVFKVFKDWLELYRRGDSVLVKKSKSFNWTREQSTAEAAATELHEN